jgi:hypothetical protein
VLDGGTDWFAAGEAVFNGTADPGFPPLGDAAAQRLWLGGFAAAWTVAPAPTADTDRLELACYRDVQTALIRALAGREDLAEQLLQHGAASYTGHRH